MRKCKWGSFYTTLAHCYHGGIRPSITRYSELSKEAWSLKFFVMLLSLKKISVSNFTNTSMTTTKPLCGPNTVYLDAEALGSYHRLWFRSFAPYSLHLTSSPLPLIFFFLKAASSWLSPFLTLALLFFPTGLYHFVVSLSSWWIMWNWIKLWISLACRMIEQIGELFNNYPRALNIILMI